MKSKAWARSFWVKAAAFFLAVALVPVGIVYGAAYAYSYSGELRMDFYETDLCSNAAFREMSGIYDTYRDYAENGQTDIYEKFPDWYPADDRSTNIRFAMEDKEGNVLYDNHREGDIPIDSWETAQNDRSSVIFRLYVAADYPAQDGIYWAREFYNTMAHLAPDAAADVFTCALAELILLVFLARAAGRRPGREEAAAGWQEKIPFDLYTLVVLGGCCGCAAVLENFDYRSCTEPVVAAGFLACLAAAYALFLAFWMTLCARVKLGRWWENTVCWRLIKLCLRVLKWCRRAVCRVWSAFAGFVRGIPLVWRTALGCCMVSVLLIAIESSDADGALLLTLLALSVAACAFSMQLRRLQRGGEALAAGDLTSQVDTSRMYFDLKRHGEDLNAISRGMSIAVEQRLKSERLKTELITNVSHDIKTPLTSIVNYVDLLQREHTPEQEKEYLAVLDRQAHKLKKLTVDLVELSKASTGNIPCCPARRSVRELIDQTVGEYAEKLAAARLEPVITLPNEDIYCLCDGALMWRVLDNLLSNACKYACPGTRLYLGAKRAGEAVEFSCKNISRDALNIDPDELLERFVRGDSSRTTEGSGLGLNIAKSLIELQKGTFSIAIDGDLFKAGFALPYTA